MTTWVHNFYEAADLVRTRTTCLLETWRLARCYSRLTSNMACCCRVPPVQSVADVNGASPVKVLGCSDTEG